ncbi:MAG: hypothetical protein JO102_01835, partial [Elusimicrobia bacterium]|nr:hypothetical protein [Elusimicrobiota bacterium]
EALLREQAALEAAVVSRLAVTPEQKRLAEMSDQVGWYRRLSDFALTPEEWAKRPAANGSLASIDGALAAQEGGPAAPFAAVPTEAFEDFYRFADRRSEAMVSKLLDGAPSAMAMVVGGFHTPEVARRLKDRGCSVIVCSPRLSKVDMASATGYLTIFSRDKTPVEKLFAGERLTINPTEVNVQSSAHLTNLFVIEAGARVTLDHESASALPAGLKSEPKGPLVHETYNGVESDVGRVTSAKQEELAGARIGRPGAYFQPEVSRGSRALALLAALVQRLRALVGLTRGPTVVDNVPARNAAAQPAVRAMIDRVRSESDSFIALIGGARGGTAGEQIGAAARAVGIIASRRRIAVGDGGTTAVGIAREVGVQRRSGRAFPLVGVVPQPEIAREGRPGAELDRNHTDVVSVVDPNWEASQKPLGWRPDQGYWRSETPAMYEIFGEISRGRPRVALVADAGTAGIGEIGENIRQNAPMIVLEGTGRAADLIAAVLAGRTIDNPTDEERQLLDKIREVGVAQHANLFTVVDARGGPAAIAAAIESTLASQEARPAVAAAAPRAGALATVSRILFGRAGIATALAGMSLSLVAASDGNAMSVLVVVLAGLAILLAARMILARLAFNPESLLMAARAGANAAVPGATRLQMQAVTGAAAQWTPGANTFQTVDMRRVGRVVEAGAGEIVILSLPRGRTGAVVGSNLTSGTSLEVRALNRATGETVLAMAHVPAGPEHLENVRSAMAALRADLVARGMTLAEVAVTWRPDQAQPGAELGRAGLVEALRAGATGSTGRFRVAIRDVQERRGTA